MNQVWHNLSFLELVNTSNNSSAFFDWQVTVCFYAAVHLVNAHLSLHNMQYRKHVDVKDALNPFRGGAQAPATALPKDEYLAYVKLQSLSRRSRYLVNDKDPDSPDLNMTYSVHLRRSLIHLNTLIKYLCQKHNETIQKINFSCPDIVLKECVFIR